MGGTDWPVRLAWKSLLLIPQGFTQYVTLRRKILLIIGATATVLIIGLSAVLIALLTRGFGRLDEQAVQRSVQQAVDALQVQLNTLASKAADWAVWDESYQFIEDRNPQFIQSNCSDATFEVLGLSLMMFVDSSGRVVYAKAFDLGRGVERPLPVGLDRWLAPGGLLLQHSRWDSVQTGIIELPEGLMLVAVRPVLNSQRSGPVRGTVIFGRFVDRGVTAQIARLTQAPVAIHGAQERRQSAEFVAPDGAFISPHQVTTQVLDADWIAGYAELKDLRGKPAVLLQVRVPREVFSYGQRIVLYLTGALAAMGLACVGLTFGLLERYVLRRVERLARAVDEVASSGNLQTRVSVSGADELAGLAAAINGMLAALEGSQSALRESQRTLATLMSNLPGMAYRCRNDARWTMEFISEGCRPLTGYAPADLIGNQKIAYADLIEPDDRAAVWAEVQAAVAARRSFQLTYRIRTATGEQKWVFEHGCAVCGAEGEVLALEGFISDITKRKKIEVALRQSEELFRSLSTSSPIGVFVADILGTWVYVNPRLCALSGLELTDCLGDGWVASVWTADRDELVQSWREYIQTGGEYSREFRIQTPQGIMRSVHLRCSPMLSDQGQLFGFVGTMEDVTERIRTTEALRQSQQQLCDLFEGSPDAIFVGDNNGRVLDANPAGCALYGLKREEILGQSMFDFVPVEQQEDARIAYEQFVSGKLEYAEGNVVSRDGHVVPVELKVRRVTFRKQPALLLHVRDVSERKQLQQKFLQSQKFEAIGRLAGGVAHDFNNILTAIIGYSELILSELPAEASLRRHAEEVLKAAQRAAGLTRQLLAFGRKQSLQPQVLDLNDVIADMNKMLRRVIGENIELVTVATSDLGAVRVDPSQIQQVVLNLAVNARDAMSLGGTLTIETCNTVVDQSLANRQEVVPGDYVTVTVRDTGTGMSDDVKHHLFEPFFTTKGVGQGSGLGLATCYGIIRQSGGFITVDSELGRGSEFRLYLPRVADAAPAEVELQHDTEPVQGHETVLVVEDEPAVRELVVTILREYGYKVIEATRGEEALRLVQQNKIDLLLTDVVMPHMSGNELARQLLVRHPRARVLFMSGYNDEAVRDQGVPQSGVAFLQKPFTGRVLLNKVREVLDQRPPGAAHAPC